MPGEAERAADLLGVSLEELFRTRLAVNWWERGSDPIFLLAPALVGFPSGEMYPSDPQGTCTFFKEGRCEIYAARPAECRQDLHDRSEEAGRIHGDVAEQWDSKAHLEQIRNLLGKEPHDLKFDWLGEFFGVLR